MKVTTAIRKLHRLKKRKRVIQGGTFAGKTYGILVVLIDYALRYPRKKITVVAETIPSLKDGAINQFLDILENTKRFHPTQFNRVDLTYHFGNGSRMQFKSFDSVGKAKAAGKRDVLFLNEANHISYDIADALMIRSTDHIWIDFNPDNEFWAHTEVLKQRDSGFLLLKYTDNEACPLVTIKELKARQEKAKTSSYWQNWCRVYIDGEIGKLEGVVFNNYSTIKLPNEARYVGSGLDFGYTNDPTALIDVYKWNNKYIFDEVIYQTQLTNNQIAKLIGKDRMVYADAAEPKSIKEIRLAGCNIKAAKKGKDSINFGIDLLQQDDFFVTENSLNLIEELNKYRWMEDRDGQRLNKPVDAWNHCVDAMRYYIIEQKPNQGEYFIYG